MLTSTEMLISRNKAQHELCVQVNLMQYMKLSTSRDFRINAATLEAALQERDESPDVSSDFLLLILALGTVLDRCLLFFFFSPQSLSEQRTHKSPNRRRGNVRIRKRNQLGKKSSFWRVQDADQSAIFLWPESRWWCWWFGKCPGPPLWNVDTHCLCELARCNIRSYDHLLFWLYINFTMIHLIDKLLKELYSYFQTVFLLLF